MATCQTTPVSLFLRPFDITNVKAYHYNYSLLERKKKNEVIRPNLEGGLRPMSAYQIQTAGWPNIEHLQNLSANALRNSALTNAILSDPKGGHVNNIQSRMILAYDVYEQALTSQASSQSTSKVLKAVNTRKLMPRIQACAWLEWVFPDPKLDGQWNDDLGAELVVPPYVNRKVYQYVENTKHSHRKTLMRGKAHYCTSRQVLTSDHLY